jgi:hypothetical protein
VVNFQAPQVVGSSVPGSSLAFTWDVSDWDGTDVWIGTSVVDRWEGADGLGYVIAPYAEVLLDADNYPTFEFSFIGWNILHEVGGLAFSS